MVLSVAHLSKSVVFRMSDPSGKRRQFSLARLLRLVTYCAIVAALIHWAISQSWMGVVTVIVFYAAVGLLVLKLAVLGVSAFSRGGGDQTK